MLTNSLRVWAHVDRAGVRVHEHALRSRDSVEVLRRAGHRMQSTSLRYECMGHSACSTSIFGYRIGAHDELPSVVGISGADGGEDAWSGRGSPSVESAGHAPHRCRETSALLVPGEHYK